MVLITYFTPKVREGIFFSRHLPHTKKEKNKLYYIIHIVCMCVCVCVLILNLSFEITTLFFSRALHFSMFYLICWFLDSHHTKDDRRWWRLIPNFEILFLYFTMMWWWCTPLICFDECLTISFPLLLIWYFCFWTGIIPLNSVCHSRLDSYQT